MSFDERTEPTGCHPSVPPLDAVMARVQTLGVAAHHTEGDRLWSDPNVAAAKDDLYASLTLLYDRIAVLEAVARIAEARASGDATPPAPIIREEKLIERLQEAQSHLEGIMDSSVAMAHVTIQSAIDALKEGDLPRRVAVGSWPQRCEQRAFVDGAKWWEFTSTGGTMWSSDREKAEAEAVRRYGEPVSQTQKREER